MHTAENVDRIETCKTSKQAAERSDLDKQMDATVLSRYMSGAKSASSALSRRAFETGLYARHGLEQPRSCKRPNPV